MNRTINITKSFKRLAYLAGDFFNSLVERFLLFFLQLFFYLLMLIIANLTLFLQILESSSELTNLFLKPYRWLTIRVSWPLLKSMQVAIVDLRFPWPNPDNFYVSLRKSPAHDAVSHFPLIASFSPWEAPEFALLLLQQFYIIIRYLSTGTGSLLADYGISRMRRSWSR